MVPIARDLPATTGVNCVSYIDSIKGVRLMQHNSTNGIPLVSVIVPVYNVEKYLNDCLSSLIQQTLDDIEILVIDDGSQDQSSALCDDWAKTDHRIHVFHKPNGGLSSARNYGIESARGKYLAFIDSDDTVHPQMLEILYRAIQDTDTLLSICEYKMVTAPVSDWTLINSQPEPQIIPRDVIFQSISTDFVVAWNKLYCRSLFHSLRYPVGRYHEDEFLAHHIFWQTPKVAKVQLPLYGYLQRSNSIMSKNIVTHYEDGLCALRDRVEFCLKQEQIDYLRWSLDTLLGQYEHLLVTGDVSLPTDIWQSIIQEAEQDYAQWKMYMRISQKLYWHWLTLKPGTYLKKKHIYEKATSNVKRLMGKHS